MSIASYATAVRNYLRSNLSDFYGNLTNDIVADPIVAANRARNCKVMLDERTTADSGQEFIAIYASTHKSRGDLMQAIDEEFGLIVAISRKIALIPPDYRGEKGFLDLQPLAIDDPDEEDQFLTTWKNTEARCREVVKLLEGSARYEIMYNANVLIGLTGGPFTEPLLWERTDATPRQVDSNHFYYYDKLEIDRDPVFGLVQKIYLGGAVRMQPISDLDRVVT